MYQHDTKSKQLALATTMRRCVENEFATWSKQDAQDTLEALGLSSLCSGGESTSLNSISEKGDSEIDQLLVVNGLS